jgi:LacI family transcriptional regulator
MEENQIALKAYSIQHVNFSRREGFKAAMNILAGKSCPEAIFGCNDYIALGVMDAARELKLNVPEDLAVVGFDDTEFARSVRLTTVSQRQYKMGDLAVQILVQSIEKKQGHLGRRIVLEPELIIRESSQPEAKPRG